MRAVALAGVMAVLAGAAWAEAAPAPMVVELFTSKYCPNCPAAESYLDKQAAADKGILIVMENVDYWDRPDAKDPYGNPDYTQRQYDYSNQAGISDRPGKVWTPMPILNGARVADTPLFINWGGALEKAKAEPAPATLKVEASESGALTVVAPAELKPALAKGADLYLIGMDRDADHPAMWRGKGVAAVPGSGSRFVAPKATLPPGGTILAVLQEVGPGKVLATAVFTR